MHTLRHSPLSAQGRARAVAVVATTAVAGLGALVHRRAAGPISSSQPARRLSVTTRAASSGREGGSGPATGENPVKEWAPPADGFKVHRITGDGSCLFRAIVQGAHMATGKPPMPLSAETTAAFNLRAAVVEDLRRRKSEMEVFIAGITDDWDGYLERMSHPAAWGGEPEIVMSVNLVKRPITVFRLTLAGRSVEPIVTYGEELKGTPVNLLWSGAHYDVLVPARQASGGGLHEP